MSFGTDASASFMSCTRLRYPSMTSSFLSLIFCSDQSPSSTPSRYSSISSLSFASLPLMNLRLTAFSSSYEYGGYSDAIR